MKIVLWFVVLELMTLATAPLVATACPRAADRGIGIARTLGLLLTGYLCWLLTSVAHVPSTGGLGWAVLAILLGFAASPWGRCQLRRIPWAQVKTTEAVFYGTTLVFLLLRAYQPEIYWGEKPMDLTFLNFFIRLEKLPPEDPWAAGHLMQYYYFGTYLLALLHKMTGLSSAIGYNVSIATIAGLFASCATCVFLQFTRNRRLAVVAALALCFLSDWEGLYLVLFQNQKHGFDLFWASSRIMPDAIANEYPLWSLLFADLHAHLIALPFTMALLALGATFFRWDNQTRSGERITSLLLYSLAWGCLLMINSWDFIAYGVVTAVLILAHPRKNHAFGGELARRIALGTATGLLSVALVAPFLGCIHVGPDNGIQLERHAFFDDRQLLRYLAQFLLPALLLAAWALYRGQVRRRLSFRQFIVPLLLVEAIWILSAIFKWHGIEQFPWAAVVVVSILIFIGASLLMSSRIPRRHRLAGTYLFCAGLLVWLGEFFFIRERLNSLFKLSMPLWILCGIAFGAFAPNLLFLLRRSPWLAGRFHSFPLPSPLHQVQQALLRLVPSLFLVGSLVASLVNMQIMLVDKKIDGLRPTLDGLAYLSSTNPDLRDLVRFIDHNIPGIPRTAEAWGDPYGPYTRIAMYTGLPTLMGWEHHVKQRGLSVFQVKERESDLEQIYTTPNPERAFTLLKEYGIRYVVMGTLERQRYGSTGESKFEASPHFHRIVRFGNEKLYEVTDSRNERATASQ